MGARRIPARRIILWIITGAVLAFIFTQSLFPQSLSAEESGWLTEKVLNPLLQSFGMQPLSQQTVRKLAHVFEFTVLSLLLSLCFYGNPVKSAGLGFTAAFLDESIQLLSGRGAQITDVWIDLIGVAAGTLIGLLICILARTRKRSEASH